MIRTVSPLLFSTNSIPYFFPIYSKAKKKEKMTDENSPLRDAEQPPNRRLSKIQKFDDVASSMVKSHTSVDEQALADSTVGERLAYNDYTTIDWLHDLVSSFTSSLFFATAQMASKLRSMYWFL